MHSDPFDDDFENDSEDQEDDKRKKRNAILGSGSLWSGAVVPYEISSVFGGMSKSLANTNMHTFTSQFCNQQFMSD